MDLTFFLANLTNPKVLLPVVYEEYSTNFSLKNYREFNPEKHKVNSKSLRQDNQILVDTFDSTGKKTGEENITVPVTRIALPYQEYLTTTGTAFLAGGNVKLIGNAESDAEKAVLKKLLEIWDDEKLDFKNFQIGTALYSETEACEIWYTKKTGEGADAVIELKCNVYSPAMGYVLIPVYDEYGSLIAFGREYETKRDKVKIKHLDLYTKDAIYRYELKSGDVAGWKLVPLKEAENGEQEISGKKLIYGKIPVVFYQTDKTIWHNVQPSIERLETAKSNHSDQNDYTGSPILAAIGKINGWSKKGQTGKVIELENGADLKYVTSDQAPESVKMEMEGLKDDIHTLTQTPNLSFAELSKISGQLSAPIMDRMLTGSHLKAKVMQQGAYGIGIQRRINFLITAISNIFDDCKGGHTLRVKPEFDLFRIGENSELVDIIMKMSGNQPILSVDEAIDKNPYSDNPADTKEKLQTQIKEADAKEEKKAKALADANKNNKPDPNAK